MFKMVRISGDLIIKFKKKFRKHYITKHLYKAEQIQMKWLIFHEFSVKFFCHKFQELIIWIAHME